MQDPEWERTRLIKLLALLASEQEGEVLAAARKITAALRSADLEWEDVIVAPNLGPLKLASLYAGERRRRVAAERAATQWRDIARRQPPPMRADRPSASEAPAQAPAARSPVSPVPAAAAPAAPLPVPPPQADPLSDPTGHPLLDRLLGASLPPAHRTRVEAIASWFRATGALTTREQAELAALDLSAA